MKNLSLVIYLIITTLFGGATFVFASELPDCPTDPDVGWHNCFGTYNWADGANYVA